MASKLLTRVIGSYLSEECGSDYSSGFFMIDINKNGYYLMPRGDYLQVGPQDLPELKQLQDKLGRGHMSASEFLVFLFSFTLLCSEQQVVGIMDPPTRLLLRGEEASNPEAYPTEREAGEVTCNRIFRAALIDLPGLPDLGCFGRFSVMSQASPRYPRLEDTREKIVLPVRIT